MNHRLWILVLCVLPGLACDEHSELDRPAPEIEVVHGELGGGALLGTAASGPVSAFFVGGAEAACGNGSRVLMQYDGVSWRFVDTTPTTGVLEIGPDEPGPPAEGECACPEDASLPCTDGPRRGALRAAASFSALEVFVAGDLGTILRVTPGEVERMDIGDDELPTFTGLWGSSRSDLWAVGGLTSPGDTVATPVLYHHDGTAWARVDAPSEPGRLLGVWGSDPDHVWAVGQAGLVLRFDGRTWRSEDAGTDETLVGVAGRGPDDVYVVGGDTRAILLRGGAGGWDEIDNDLSGSLMAVLPGPDGELLLGGRDGLMAAGAPDDLVAFDELRDDDLLGRTSFCGFAAISGGALAVGGNIFELGREDLHGTVVGFGAQVSTSFAARADSAGGAFPVAEPPPVAGGGTTGGW